MTARMVAWEEEDDSSARQHVRLGGLLADGTRRDDGTTLLVFEEGGRIRGLLLGPRGIDPGKPFDIVAGVQPAAAWNGEQ